MPSKRMMSTICGCGSAASSESVVHLVCTSIMQMQRHLTPRCCLSCICLYFCIFCILDNVSVCVCVCVMIKGYENIYNMNVSLFGGL